MAGKSRFYGYLGGLIVPDLTDQYYVGVLSKEGAQTRREREPDFLMNLDLIDSRQTVFNRVFGR